MPLGMLLVVSIGNVDIPCSTSRMLMNRHSGGDGEAFYTYIFPNMTHILNFTTVAGAGKYELCVASAHSVIVTFLHLEKGCV